MQIDFEDERVRVGHTVVGPIDNNVFFITDKATNESAMIDAASSPSLLIEMCSRMGVKQILTTHGHWDHIGAVPEMRAAGYPVAIGEHDTDRLSEYDSVLVDNGDIKVGTLIVKTYNTPGHTAGSTCFHVEGTPLLFTGDTLFPGGPGAFHFPGGDFENIMRSLDRLFDMFDDETIVLPGHGANTTIGAERPSLPAWHRQEF